ncbi:MAG: aspartate--tRNA ligase [Firmicutes bacterium]|nr:aspartate--tRNA ligase [Bacillota bacterium]
MVEKMMKRTDYCGDLRLKDDGREVVLCGWVMRTRDHGGLIFIDLRDRQGLVQVVFDPQGDAESFALAEQVRSEYVLNVKGRVRPRPEDTANENLATGEVEVVGSKLIILNRAKTPPFYIEDDVNVDELLRLRYRYLDLRRPVMQDAIKLRHKTAMAMRRFLDEAGFYEIETPMLGKSSPEGARDYLVPSRVHPGEFYALPQSPQLFKQMLMVAGMDKYFQIARCFRDEDLRADRQPEFTQLDMEMSFVEEEDVRRLCEDMLAYVFRHAMGREIPTPFPTISYAEAMSRFGSDKPDLRFGMELIDIADIAAESDFTTFASVAKKGGWVRGINAKGCAGYSRRDMDALKDFVGVYGARGLAYIMVREGELHSPITKFFTEDQTQRLLQRMGAEPGDLLMFVAADWRVAAESLGHLRQEIAKREGLIDDNELNFLWVTDFPMFEYDAGEGRWTAMHHPFTMPKDEDLPVLMEKPGEVRAKAYDCVLNGVELGGGSIRIHRRDVQEKIFALLNISEEESKDKFGYLLDAFEYGAPPHGGVAFGLDRMIMLMGHKDSIRDVIAFPKTQSAACLMTQAPSSVTIQQLRELHIRPSMPQKKNAGEADGNKE